MKYKFTTPFFVKTYIQKKMIIAVVFKEEFLKSKNFKEVSLKIEEIFCSEKFNLWLHNNLKNKVKRTLFLSTVSKAIAANVLENLDENNMIEYLRTFPCYESWKAYLIER